MLIWFAGLSIALVWQVFRDTALDYRLVMLGAILPDVLDAPFGGARVLHTVVFSASLLVLVMLGTRGRRHARRRWLAMPIGTFVHLLLDGVWSHTATFWWPIFGWRFEDRLPWLERSAMLLVVQELAGIAALVWFWQRFRLGDSGVRASFARTGRLPRDGLSS